MGSFGLRATLAAALSYWLFSHHDDPWPNEDAIGQMAAPLRYASFAEVRAVARRLYTSQPGVRLLAAFRDGSRVGILGPNPNPFMSLHTMQSHATGAAIAEVLLALLERLMVNTSIAETDKCKMEQRALQRGFQPQWSCSSPREDVSHTKAGV